MSLRDILPVIALLSSVVATSGLVVALGLCYPADANAQGWGKTYEYSGSSTVSGYWEDLCGGSGCDDFAEAKADDLSWWVEVDEVYDSMDDLGRCRVVCTDVYRQTTWQSVGWVQRANFNGGPFNDAGFACGYPDDFETLFPWSAYDVCESGRSVEYGTYTYFGCLLGQ